jgi:type II secretory pathway pseudopilin PulG
MIKSSKKIEEGFTLVEMLVSIAVFMTVMVIAVGSFISILNANKKSQAMKTVVDNITFAVDSISRSIKVGNNYKCDDNATKESIELSNSCPNGGNLIQYYNVVDKTYVQYIFIKTDDIVSDIEGNIQKRICQPNKDGCGAWRSMTGPVSNINIKNMKFYVLGADTDGQQRGSREQPRVIITVEGASGDENMYSNTSFMLQTTISQMDRVKD